MAGGLFDPLGADRPDRPAPRRPAAAVVAAVALAGLGGLVLVAWLRDTGDRGRPTAVVPIERPAARPVPPPTPASAPAQVPPAAPAPPAADPGLPPVRADQEVEVQNGVRIVRPRRTAPAGSGSAIVVPPPASTGR